MFQREHYWVQRWFNDHDAACGNRESCFKKVACFSDLTWQTTGKPSCGSMFDRNWAESTFGLFGRDSALADQLEALSNDWRRKRSSRPQKCRRAAGDERSENRNSQHIIKCVASGSHVPLAPFEKYNLQKKTASANPNWRQHINLWCWFVYVNSFHKSKYLQRLGHSEACWWHM